MVDRLLTVRPSLFGSIGGHGNRVLQLPSDPSWTPAAAHALAESLRIVHRPTPAAEWLQAMWILRAYQLASSFDGLSQLEAWVALLQPCVSASMLCKAANGSAPIT
jgi:hypothetical protein